VRNHDFDKTKLLFQLSETFRMRKTYAARLPRFYSLIDLTHFSADNETTIYRHWYLNYGCACDLQTLCLTTQPRPLLKVEICLMKE